MKLHILAALLVCSLVMTPIFADDDAMLVVKEFQVQDNLQLVDGGISVVLGSEGTFTSQAVAADSSFNAGFVSWKSNKDEGLTVQIRVSADGTSWGEWSEPCKREMEMTWQAPQNFMQFKVSFERNCSAVVKELNFMHTLNTVNAQDIHEQVVKANEMVQMNQAVRFAKPYIVSRSGWGARPPKGGYSSHSPNKITLHHSWRPSKAQYKGASTIRGIQNYHMDSNGWSDVGYHFLIGTDSSGNVTIFQGRPENKIGAHTGGYNTHNIGICIIGDHDVEPLHPNTYAKLVQLMAWLCATYGISPNNFYGHTNFSSKTCPGGIVYSKMSQIKQDVRSKLGW